MLIVPLLRCCVIGLLSAFSDTGVIALLGNKGSGGGSKLVIRYWLLVIGISDY